MGARLGDLSPDFQSPPPEDTLTSAAAPWGHPLLLSLSTVSPSPMILMCYMSDASSLPRKTLRLVCLIFLYPDPHYP